VVIEEDEEEELPQEMCLLPEYEQPTESTTTDENKQEDGFIESSPSKQLGS